MYQPFTNTFSPEKNKEQQTERFSTAWSRKFKSKLLPLIAIPVMLGAASTAASAYTISGTVFRAPNGLPLTNPNGSLHGTPTGILLGQPLYIYIVNQSKTIIFKTQVNPNGTYSISNLVSGQAGAAQLASTNYNVGSTVSFVGLPTDYYAVGEGENAAGDPNPDYSFPLAQTADVTVNFAFEERPGSTNVIISNYTYTNGRLNVPATAFNGSDPEDGAYLNNLAGRTLDFYPPTPLGGTRLFYYDTVLNFTTAATSVTVNNFNPSKVSLEVSGTAATRGFSYTVADNAGARPYVPATISTTSPLFIALASFSGSWLTDFATINWATASEKNSDYFELERSGDGVQFKSIERIASKAGNGNSDGLLTYTYQDKGVNNAGLQEAYYRLRSIDKNGTTTLSKVLHLRSSDAGKNAGNSGSFTIYPNPATDYLNIVSLAELKQATTATLTSATGQVLFSRNLNSAPGENGISLTGLPNGQYFLTIGNANDALLNQQITIAR